MIPMSERESRQTIRRLEGRIGRVLNHHGVSPERHITERIAWELFVTGNHQAGYADLSSRVEGEVVRFLKEARVGQLALDFFGDHTPEASSEHGRTSIPQSPILGRGSSRSAPEGHSGKMLRRAGTIFGLIELILPKRLSEEEIGDALEILDQLIASSAPSWKIHLKIVSTVAWLILNVMRELSSALLGRKRA